MSEVPCGLSVSIALSRVWRSATAHKQASVAAVSGLALLRSVVQASQYPELGKSLVLGLRGWRVGGFWATSSSGAHQCVSKGEGRATHKQ